MADMLRKILLLGVLINVLFFLAPVDGLARRGGRGGGSRSYRSSSIRSSRVRVHHNVVMSGRIVRGSSIYTASNWRVAFMAGTIYGSTRHTHMYRDRMPPICTNLHEKRPSNGTESRVLGYFICPKDSDSEDEIYCCGPDNREYCCNKTMAEIYYSKHYHFRSSGPSIGSIIGAIISAVVLIAVAVICCKKRKHAGAIIRRFSKRGGRTKHDGHGPQSVPLNSAENTHGESTVISQAPPSYTAATSVGYDGGQAYPYSGPYPSQPFPPGGPQPYPPYNVTEDKTGSHPPEIYPGQPYKPSDGQAPYPPMPNGSEQTSYPPPSGEPYPPPSGAPYPPPSGTPYPLPGEAPYLPPPGAPYTYSAPYPASSPGVAPYPVNPELPYPQPVAQNYDAPPYPMSESGAGDNSVKVFASAPTSGNTYA